jgi:hypothetical protein
MPVTDIAMDVEGWSLEPVGADPEDTHILTLYSGSVAVEGHLTPDDLLMLADAIEEALERLEDVPLDWTPTRALEGAWRLTFRLSLAGVQAYAPYAAGDEPVSHWTLILDDEDTSQAMLSVRHSDIGALLHRLRLINLELDDDSPGPHPVLGMPYAAGADRIDEATALRFLAMVTEARRNRRAGQNPLLVFAQIMQDLAARRAAEAEADPERARREQEIRAHTDVLRGELHSWGLPELGHEAVRVLVALDEERGRVPVFDLVEAERDPAWVACATRYSGLPDETTEHERWAYFYRAAGELVGRNIVRVATPGQRRRLHRHHPLQLSTSEVGEDGQFVLRIGVDPHPTRLSDVEQLLFWRDRAGLEKVAPALLAPYRQRSDCQWVLHGLVDPQGPPEPSEGAS